METTAIISVPLSLRLSGSALKIIAILSMMADHCAYFLMEPDSPMYDLLRCIGRIAFPVFAFLAAEGFAHSRDRMRYFLILLLAGAVSELPWYLLNGADGTHMSCSLSPSELWHSPYSTVCANMGRCRS